MIICELSAILFNSFTSQNKKKTKKIVTKQEYIKK